MSPGFADLTARRHKKTHRDQVSGGFLLKSCKFGRLTAQSHARRPCVAIKHGECCTPTFRRCAGWNEVGYQSEHLLAKQNNNSVRKQERIFPNQKQ
jgi:hypothetical protein